MQIRGSASRRKERQGSSDMDLSDDDEEDKIEQLLSHHQQRDLASWGQSDQASSSNVIITSSRARRDARRDEQRRRRRDESSIADVSFEVDTVGAGATSSSSRPTSILSKAITVVKNIDGLLLPGHVAVDSDEDGSDEKDEKLIAESKDFQDDFAKGELGDYIRIDADRPGLAARYYEVEEDEVRKAHEECPTCGEKGHDKKSCPHDICLACGALDEHTTRECPAGLSCFRCGGRGHKAHECKLPRSQGPQGWKECPRCGSGNHVEASCPTLWRIYCYNSLDDHRRARRQRYKEAGLAQPIKRNGFDYRSDESESEEGARAPSPVDPPKEWDPAVRWCYNCAAEGNHWGDDCPLPRCNPTRGSNDPSGYSEFLAASGPLARYLPPPPPLDAQAYRNGLRQNGQYDRFRVGPGASMHIYDPQREAMRTVDHLLDGYSNGARRRRDLHKYKDEGRKAPADRKPVVDRKSGQGSKAQRYREQDEERKRQRDQWWDQDRYKRESRNGGRR